MRIAFLGTPEFAVPTLDALHAEHEVVLVVAQPDKPSGRGQAMTAPPVAARAKALGLPLTQPKAIKSGAFPELFTSLNLDVAVVIAYGRILTPTLLTAPRWGCVNVHASILPRWRGAAPIQWSIWSGDVETGVCTQRMEEGLDTGPIYLAERTPIGDRETAGELHDRLMALSAEVAVATLRGLAERTPLPQDNSLATHCGKLDKQMGAVDFTQSAAAIDRQIRAMTPWPGGFLAKPEGPLKLLTAHPVEGQGSPGQILSTSPLTIACGEGALVLDKVQAAGKKPVSGVDFANGARLVRGETL